MDADLKRLYDGFRGIRTMCTGIMGYLAMLHEGDFKGGESPIVDNLQKATTTVTQKLDALRDVAARMPHGRSPAVDEAAAIIISSESKLRQPLQALSARLASTVADLPHAHWGDDLRLAQTVVREVAAMHEALKAATPTATGISHEEYLEMSPEEKDRYSPGYSMLSKQEQQERDRDDGEWMRALQQPLPPTTS